jgi:hypothetical protein
MIRTPSRRIRRCAALLGVAALLATGCAARPRGNGITASYCFRTLYTELEPTVSVVTATTAAEQALRARGYSIAASSTSEDRGVVIGKHSGAREFEKAVVESRVTKTGTSIAVRLEPFGDEAASYAIMDALLSRIGR